MKSLNSENGVMTDLRTGAGPAHPELRVVDVAPLPDPASEVTALAAALLEKEKRRWAYEIHDGLTQTVAAAILQIEMLSRRISTDPEAAAVDLSDAALEMRSTMADIRSMLFNLSAGASDGEDPPTERVRACVDDVAGRWGLETRLTIEGDLIGTPAAVLTVSQVVIHEALTNAAKHARSGGADVTVTAGRRGLIVSVHDSGTGLGENKKRFGMRMMERRVREIGGTLEVESSSGGTLVTAHFPIGA